MRELPLLQVDAFSDRALCGNPCAVVLDAAGLDDDTMLAIAREMNLSETAFVEPATTPGGEWHLRWFTPAAEVELCGHATLASAHLLWETRRAPGDRPLTFHTRHRGDLICRRLDDGRIAMDFPADTVELDTPPPDRLLETLGLSEDRVEAVAEGRYDWLIELPSPADVMGLRPDFAALRRFDTRGVAVTAWVGDEGTTLTGATSKPHAAGKLKPDIVSRFFAPRLRIEEDPVTGSLHCLLGPYWRAKRGVDRLEAYQASPRGGHLGVVTHGDRVELIGQAVTVLRGELTP